MADPYHKSFNRRLKTIDRIQRRGGGFEAAGTLGQSYYTGLSRKNGPSLFRPALTVALLFIAFKAMLLAHQGPGTYYARLAVLESGTVGQQFSAKVLAVDPLTEMMAVWFSHVVK